MKSDVGLFEDTASAPEFIIESVALAGIEKRVG
jgi:hypothetical protein